MSRVTLVTRDDEVERQLARALGVVRFEELVGRCDAVQHLDAEGAAAHLAEDGTEVLVVGPDFDVVEALCLAETIERLHPEITTLLVSRPTPELWELALQAGFRNVIDAAAGEGQLRVAIERAVGAAERRRANIVIDLRDDVSVAPVVSAATDRRVITVLSPKGGAGKTTTSTNLAASLAERPDTHVVLVDLDLQFGDVASALGIQPSASIADLGDGPGALEPAGIKALLHRHDSGIFVLAAPDDPAAGEDVPAERLADVLRILTRDFTHVVVDTSAGIDAAALAAVEVSTDLVLVGAMDVPSIRSVKKLLDALDRLGMNEARRHLVLNRADSRVGIDHDDVSATLGLPVTICVPSSRSVPVSVNVGSPVVLSDRRSPVVRPMEELSELFVKELAGAGSRSWFRRSTR